MQFPPKRIYQSSQLFLIKTVTDLIFTNKTSSIAKISPQWKLYIFLQKKSYLSSYLPTLTWCCHLSGMVNFDLMLAHEIVFTLTLFQVVGDFTLTLFQVIGDLTLFQVIGDFTLTLFQVIGDFTLTLFQMIGDFILTLFQVIGDFILTLFQVFVTSYWPCFKWLWLHIDLVSNDWWLYIDLISSDL